MYYKCRKHPITVIAYILWVAVEILSMATFYTAFEGIVLHDTRDFFEMIKQSVINTSLVLLLPYSTTWLYFAMRDKSKKLERYREDSILESKSIFLFNDEKNNLRLSVKKGQVYYIESADNYVKIHYLNRGKMSIFMLRNKIKKIEEDFRDSTLTRCHRSYIVNFDNVKVLRKEKDSTFIGFDNEQIPDIPVSRSYVENVVKMFYKYSS
jgi:DNA-binding LytR/AlgR family response regulator